MKKVFSLIAVVALFASCVADKLEDGESMLPENSTTQTDPTVVSLDDALDGMFDLMNDLYGPGTRAAGRSIASIDNFNGAGGKTRADGSPETLAYVVNFEEGGFAVLSATTDHEPVVCITEGGSLTLEDLEEARNKRLNPEPVTTEGPMWMSYEDIHNFGYGEEGNPEPFVYEDYAVDWEEGDTVTEDLGDYLVSGVSDMIVPKFVERYLAEPDPPITVDHDPDPERNPDPNQPPPVVTYKWSDWINNTKTGPFLTTKWDQDAPFNNFCPPDPTDSTLTSYAGCVAIALAQIIAWNEKPATSYYGVTSTWEELKSYNYELDSSSPLYREDLVNDLATIIHEIGIAVDMNYSYHNGSGAYASEAKKYLKNSLDYSEVKRKYNKSNYEPKHVMEMLNRGLPVYIGASGDGKGHAWVIDGKLTQTAFLSCYHDDVLFSKGSTSRLLLHCNFGWGSTADGYYVPAVFNPSIGPVSIEPERDSLNSGTNGRLYYEKFNVIKYRR